MAPLLFALVLVTILHKASTAIPGDIHVTTIEHWPFLMPNHKTGEGFEGIIVDILDEVARRCNFSYTLDLVKDNTWGRRRQDGTWTGMIGEVINNEADIAAAPLVIMSGRSRFIRYTQPYMSSGIRILYTKPSDWLASHAFLFLLKPFSLWMWGILALTLAVITALFIVIVRYSPYEKWSFILGREDEEPLGERSLSSSLFHTLSTLMWQRSRCLPRSSSGRVLTSAWWLFSILVLVSFTSNLTALFLTHNSSIYSVPFTSFEELVQQDDVSFGCAKYGHIASYLETSQEPLAKRLWEQINRDDANLAQTTAAGITKVRASRGAYAFLMEGPMAEYAAGGAPCDLITLGQPLNDKGYAFACNIASDICNIIDNKILEMKEEDVILRIKEKWMNRGCDATKGRELIYDGVDFIDTMGLKGSLVYDKPVTVRKFTGVLVLFLLGAVLASVCLCAEANSTKRTKYTWKREALATSFDNPNVSVERHVQGSESDL
ncbi:glutamate receptor 2-like isoform X1 [Haliotis cracherodii]|uniref:glutamate receptor 2-like isoform X1 n=2 Tax=Haliotis cracherodii TaxID=6455 RepID=UPI0039E7FD70